MTCFLIGPFTAFINILHKNNRLAIRTNTFEIFLITKLLIVDFKSNTFQSSGLGENFFISLVFYRTKTELTDSLRVEYNRSGKSIFSTIDKCFNSATGIQTFSQKKQRKTKKLDTDSGNNATRMRISMILLIVFNFSKF